MTQKIHVHFIHDCWENGVGEREYQDGAVVYLDGKKILTKMDQDYTKEEIMVSLLQRLGYDVSANDTYTGLWEDDELEPEDYYKDE